MAKLMGSCFNGIQLLTITLLVCTFSCGSSVALSPSSTTPSEKYPFFPHSAIEEKRIRKMVDDINAAGLPWKAEYNAQASLEGKDSPRPTKEHLAAEEGLTLKWLDTERSISKLLIGDTISHMRELTALSIELPEAFDARDKWTRCASIHHIQNQGGCGSCWASAAVSVLSDRLCISSNYTEQHVISIQDLVSCCDYCGTCGGGHVDRAFMYWKNTGIVTGGSFGSNEGCKPYEIESTCGVPCPAYFHQASFNPHCEKKCGNLYGKEYTNDLRKGLCNNLEKLFNILFAGKSFYYVKKYDGDSSPFEIMTNNNNIKKEIITHGPVAFCASVDEPFAHYRSGIYTLSSFKGHENLDYGHCMRIIGWGRENGEEFWTIANSWGRQWGEHGFGRLSFKYPVWEVCGALW